MITTSTRRAGSWAAPDAFGGVIRADHHAPDPGLTIASVQRVSPV
jgi:hypothetical protein